MTPATHPILLYDGVCGLCNRVVQFVLRRDADATFRFAALESGVSRSILSRHDLDPGARDTVVVVLPGDQGTERLLVRSDAILFLLRHLSWPWRLVARLGGLLPRALRDGLYRAIAGCRYQVFGKYASCPIPEPGIRDRFLDSQP